MKRNLSIATNNTESTETSVDETIIPVEMKKKFLLCGENGKLIANTTRDWFSFAKKSGKTWAGNVFWNRLQLMYWTIADAANNGVEEREENAAI